MTSAPAPVLIVPPDIERQPAEAVLRVIGVSKEFRFYHHPWDKLMELISGGRLQRSQVFAALKNVTFDVARGEALGIVGANGAGKSTLLKIICGTLYPTAGRVELAGRIASLLELGTGFHPDFTGRQNIVFNARFLGLNDEEIHERMEAVIAFSELGEFIDRPLRTYSSGMQVRLAFAVMANVNPQILIIDEALAVGDAYFQQKCVRRIRQFREEGVTLLFVSHDPAAVKTLCSEALLLHHGQIVDRGRPEEVLASYNTLIARAAGNREIFLAEAERPTTAEPAVSHRAGSFAAVIEQVQVCDGRGQECRSFVAGETATITVRIVCFEELTDPTVGILIRDRLGNDVYGTNTHHQQLQTGRCRMREELEVSFRLALNLGPGEYSLTVAVHTQDVHVYDSFDWIDRVLMLKILPPMTGYFIGTTFLQPHVTCHRRDGSRRSENWGQMLAQALGRDFPRELTMTNGGKPWLLAGWYTLEGVGEEAFCWTNEESFFLCDLRGETLYLEAGTDLPSAATEPVDVSARLFDQPLGTFRVGGTTPWSVYSVPIPVSCQVAQGLVHMQVKGWCPAENGVNGDRRLLGVRVRRIWVAERPNGR